MDARLRGVIDGAQVAALDDSRWGRWARDLHDLFGTVGGLLAIVNRRGGGIRRADPVLHNAKGYEEYLAGMALYDPQIPFTASIDRPCIYLDSDHAAQGDPMHDDYYRWQEDRFGFYTHTSLTIPLSNGLSFAMSMHFSRDRADRAVATRRTLMPMLAALRSAVQTGFEHNEMLTEAYWEGVRFGRDQRFVALLNSEGRVVRLNATAERVVAARDPLTFREGRLAACRPSEDGRLQTVLQAALGSAPVGGVIALRCADHSPLMIDIHPFAAPRRLLVTDSAAAILIGTFARAIEETPARWQDLLDLTAAEAKVAAFLCRGMRDEDIAARTGTRVSTVRSHVAAVLAKAGVGSKSELAHLLTRLADG